MAGRVSVIGLVKDWCIFLFFMQNLYLEKLVCILNKDNQNYFLSFSGHSFRRNPKSGIYSSCCACRGVDPEFKLGRGADADFTLLIGK